MPPGLTLTIRPARPDDLGSVDALLARSYPRLLKADYAPSVMVAAVPLIARARPELLRCGTYFVAESAEGAILAAGGWTRATPRGEARASATGNVRHVVCHDAWLRRGIAGTLMRHAMQDARAAGIVTLDCLSTLTARPFYAALGFGDIGPDLGPVTVPLAPGIGFPAVRMRLRLPSPTV